MAKVLIAGANTLTCPHKFAIPVLGSSKLTVGGAAGAGVLTKKPVLAATPSCTEPVTQTTAPCKKVTAISAAMKLTVGGDPVVLDSEIGTTSGMPATPVTATASQSKLTAS
jgi:hypothetical protein